MNKIRIKLGATVLCEYNDITYVNNVSEKETCKLVPLRFRIYGRLLSTDNDKTIIISEDCLGEETDSNTACYVIPTGCIAVLRKMRYD